MNNFGSQRYMIEGVLELPHPAQFFERENEKTPEYKLCLAIMFDVVGILAGKNKANTPGYVYHETIDWVNCSEDHGPFSFISVCSVLEWEPDITRSALKRFVRSESKMMFRRSPVQTAVKQIKVKAYV